jgi:hypothetical protein
MANFEVLSLDPTTPQIRAPGAGDGYSVPRDMTFATGTTLNAPTTVVSVNTSTDALRITQVGAGNALVVEDSANPDATPTVIDASGNVGIGTASPDRKFHVYTVDATGKIGLFQNGNTNTNLYLSSDPTSGGGVINVSNNAASAALPLLFQGNGTERMRLDASGNLGIGTTSPGQRLVLAQAGDTYAVLNNTTAGYNSYISTLTNDTRIGNDAVKPITFYTNGSERARITAAGNFGIGTTSPNIAGYGANSRVLTVQGVSGSYAIAELSSNSANTDGTYIGRLDFSSAGQAAGYENCAAIASFLSGSTSTKFGSVLQFFTRADNAGSGTPVERARITAVGNLLLGSTSESSGLQGDAAHIRIGGLRYISGPFSSTTSQNFDAPICYNAFQDGGQTYKAIVSNSSSDFMPVVYAQRQGSHIFKTTSSATANSAITFTDTFFVNHNGPAAVGCIGVGNTNASTSGAGITFPATQSASSNANTLDDYEEGTWTPSYAGGVSSVTYGSVRQGYYTKVGNQVTIWVALMTDALTVGSGAITITGLPFTAANNASGSAPLALTNSTRWVSNPPLYASTAQNSTSINLYKDINLTGAGTDPTAVVAADASNGSSNRNMFYGTTTYSV